MYFIFKPISLLSGTLALVIPLLHLFDISNVVTGSIKRKISRVSRAIDDSSRLSARAASLCPSYHAGTRDHPS
jgi:hypothetical protein